MTEITDGKDKDEHAAPDIDVPYDMRPDLTELGIIEVERGVCIDSYENRAIMRRAAIRWDTVWDTYGKPTEFLMGRSEEALAERRVMNINEKRALLSDSKDNNSDYITGVALMIEEKASRLAPPWVLGATKRWISERAGESSGRKNPSPLPHRCVFVKTDGLRCMFWSNGLVTDGGLCRTHLSKTKHHTSQAVEKARQKIMQSAPYAVDVLEEMMIFAVSEPTRLKAATEILDRAGVRGGVEIDITGDLTVRSSADIVSERLDKLAAAAARTQEVLAEHAIEIADVIIDTPAEEKTDDDNGGSSG